MSAADSLTTTDATTDVADGAMVAVTNDTTTSDVADGAGLQTSGVAADVVADDADDEDGAPARSDEGLLDRMVEERFPEFNKTARNRFGTGKVLMIGASRNAQRNQRKIEAEIPPDAIKWAASAEMETHLVILAKDNRGRHRVIKVDITEHLEELKSGRTRFSLSLWDDFGNSSKISATIGTAKNPIALDEISVEDWIQE